MLLLLFQFELEFNDLYEEALQRNSSLNEELKTLQGQIFYELLLILYFLIEEYDHIYSPWSCEFCTLINQPYSVTGRNVCEACESASPLKLGK